MLMTQHRPHQDDDGQDDHAVERRFDRDRLDDVARHQELETQQQRATKKGAQATVGRLPGPGESRSAEEDDTDQRPESDNGDPDKSMASLMAKDRVPTDSKVRLTNVPALCTWRITSAATIPCAGISRPTRRSLPGRGVRMDDVETVSVNEERRERRKTGIGRVRTGVRTSLIRDRTPGPGIHRRLPRARDPRRAHRAPTWVPRHPIELVEAARQLLAQESGLEATETRRGI